MLKRRPSPTGAENSQRTGAGKGEGMSPIPLRAVSRYLTSLGGHGGLRKRASAIHAGTLGLHGGRLARNDDASVPCAARSRALLFEWLVVRSADG
jgi:hypothetical protein